MAGHGRPGRDLTREAAIARAVADLAARMEQGGLAEAGLRALLYIGLGRPRAGVDERGFAMLRHARRQLFADQPFSLARFKTLVREQYLLLLLDEDRAVAAIPALLGSDVAARAGTLDIIRRVAAASGELSDETARRLDRVETLFTPAAAKNAPAARRPANAAAS